MSAFLNFWREEEATTAVEYAVMLALILLGCIVAVRALGDSGSGMWGNNKAQLDAAGF
ncbi:MAG: Flp family type IVb pilin [Planctomycetaceae bacterium]